MDTIQSYGMTNYLSKKNTVSFGNKERLIKIIRKEYYYVSCKRYKKEIYKML